MGKVPGQEMSDHMGLDRWMMHSGDCEKVVSFELEVGHLKSFAWSILSFIKQIRITFFLLSSFSGFRIHITPSIFVENSIFLLWCDVLCRESPAVQAQEGDYRCCRKLVNDLCSSL